MSKKSSVMRDLRDQARSEIRFVRSARARGDSFNADLCRGFLKLVLVQIQLLRAPLGWDRVSA